MATEKSPVYAHAGIVGASTPGPTDFQYEARQKETAQKVLAAAKMAAEKLGVTADTVLVPEAHPAEAIIELAMARGCNLIVMASHGRRGLRKLVLGSQTSEVLAHSQIPVLVVR
jgi:nucleotide-binding universal stress UspA family protein